MITAIVDLTVQDYGEFKKAYEAEKPSMHNFVELACGESTATPGNVFVVLQMESQDCIHELFEDKAMHAVLDETKEKLGVAQLNGITFLS